MSIRHFLKRPRAVSAAEAKALIEEGAVVVDVRRERDWARHHIPGSINIPLTQLESRALELPEDRLLITFCVGGLISSGAATLLTEFGFDAVSMSRGLIDWRSIGGELATS